MTTYKSSAVARMSTRCTQGWQTLKVVALAASLSYCCTATSASADVADFFLSDDLPAKVKREFEKNAHAGLDYLMMTAVGETKWNNGLGTVLKPLLAQVPFIGMFSSAIFDGWIDTGPSAQESLVRILTAAIAESEGRIVDSVNKSASDRVIAAAQGIFDWHGNFMADPYWSLETGPLENLSMNLSDVRNALETAGGVNSLQNLHVYMVLAGLELQVLQRIAKDKYLKHHPSATEQEIFESFRKNSFGNIISNVEDYVIYGTAGNRKTWLDVYGTDYRGYKSINNSVYIKGLEPVLSIIDDWRKAAGLRRRDWADAEFYKAKTLKGFQKGSVVQENYNGGLFRINLTPSLYEPFEISTATIRKYTVSSDGTSRTENLYLTGGNKAGGFIKEQSVIKPSVIEYTVKEVCGYMYMSSTKRCMTPSYTNKIVLNISLSE